MSLSYANQIEFSRTHQEIDDVLYKAKNDSDIDNDQYEKLKRKAEDVKKWTSEYGRFL